MDVSSLQLVRTQPGSKTSINDTPPKSTPEDLLATQNLQAVQQHYQAMYQQSEHNLVQGLKHHAGLYKDKLQAAYTEEVDAVKEKAEAEVHQTKLEAEHFAATERGCGDVYF